MKQTVQPVSRAKVIAALALVLCLSVVNWQIYKKEEILSHGQAVFLKLAPIDPRSLMQGDYMALRFEMANQISSSLRMQSGNTEEYYLRPRDGYAVVTLDNEKVGKFNRLYDNSPRNADEVLIRFRLRNGEIKFATNAYFFQEGLAKHYESAEYGKFMVSADGELILVSLHDKVFRDSTTSAADPERTR